MPLVLFPGAGSELYRGLGSVVLGGLVVSTVFTLVLVPTLFNLLMTGRVALGGQVAAGPVTTPLVAARGSTAGTQAASNRPAWPEVAGRK